MHFLQGTQLRGLLRVAFRSKTFAFSFSLCSLPLSLSVSFTHSCWLLLYIRTLAGVGNFLVANCRNRQNPYPYWKMGQCNVKRETKNAFRAGAINAFLWLCSRFSVFMDNKLTMFTFACVLYLSNNTHSNIVRSFVVVVAAVDLILFTSNHCVF